MHKDTILLDIDLRLFNGAAGGAAAGGEGAATGGAAQATESSPKAEGQTGRGSSRRAKAGAYDNVIYGKQEDAPDAADADLPDAGGDAQGEGKSGVTTTSDSLEAKRQAFKDLIEGEYKAQFEETFQAAFNRRFKGAKSMETALSAQKPIMDMLMQRYNIGDGDVGKLQAAIEKDDAYWEEAAEKAGLTVDQYRAMQKLERENRELRSMRQRQEGEERAQQQLAAWYQEAEAVKAIYPGFDFKTEAQDRNFMGLLRSGIGVRQAYELQHMDEIKAAAAKTAAQSAGAQMVAKLKGKASRPLENGTSSQSAAIVKSDVSNLTRADRAEIARRAQRGEKIRF